MVAFFFADKDQLFFAMLCKWVTPPKVNTIELFPPTALLPSAHPPESYWGIHSCSVIFALALLPLRLLQLLGLMMLIQLLLLLLSMVLL